MNDAARGIIRQWMGDLIAPSEAWSYLWKPSHERGLSDTLDLACGYEEGTAGWVLDAAFAGEPLFVPRWLEHWPLNDQPLLAVCARGRPQDGGFKHGIFLRSPLEKFLDAYLEVGRWDFVKVGDWAAAAKQATATGKAKSAARKRSGVVP